MGVVFYRDVGRRPLGDFCDLVWDCGDGIGDRGKAKWEFDMWQLAVMECNPVMEMKWCVSCRTDVSTN